MQIFRALSTGVFVLLLSASSATQARITRSVMPSVHTTGSDSGVDCVRQRALIIKAYMQSVDGQSNSVKANGLLTRRELNAAYTQAAVCMKQLKSEGRTNLLKVIPDNPTATDLTSISPVAAAIRTDFYSLHKDLEPLAQAQIMISGWVSAPRGQEAAYKAEVTRLMDLTGEENYWSRPENSVFTVKDAPKLQALYLSIAKSVHNITDITVLNRIANDLLPFYNVARPANYSSIAISSVDSDGRQMAVRGEDVYSQAIANPTPLTLIDLLYSQADPMQQSKVLAEYNRRKTLPGPKAAELAAMMSQSFYRAQPELSQLESMSAIRKGTYGTYGSWVAWELPVSIGGVSAHSERYYFFVNDLPGPLCLKKPAGYECQMQIFIDRDIQDVRGEIAGSLLATMSGSDYDPDAFVKKTKLNYDARNFEWTDITLTVTGQASAWRSSVVDQFMTDFARKENERRIAAAKASNATPAPDPNRQLCNSIAAGSVASMNFSATNSLSYQMMC